MIKSITELAITKLAEMAAPKLLSEIYIRIKPSNRVAFNLFWLIDVVDTIDTKRYVERDVDGVRLAVESDAGQDLINVAIDFEPRRIKQDYVPGDLDDAVFPKGFVFHGVKPYFS